MTRKEIVVLMDQLKTVFDVVRLVDADVTAQITFDEEGNPVSAPYQCYAYWNRERRCANCISAKALLKKGKVMKFEFIGQEVYYVIGMYMEVDGTPYVLELLSKIMDDTILGKMDKQELTETLANFNERLYMDSLTRAYNRRYYEEQLRGLDYDAIAMLDMDDFKKINDTYGHQTGDAVLRMVVDTILSCVRGTDAVVRYGGDEFVVVFWNIPKEVFAMRLEVIRSAVERLRLPDHPDARISVSIGGVYCMDEGSEDALLEADRLLYVAKHEKNSVQIK